MFYAIEQYYWHMVNTYVRVQIRFQLNKSWQFQRNSDSIAMLCHLDVFIEIWSQIIL
jgi:hypothetical protein